MKTRAFLIRVASVLAIASLGFAISCKEDEPQFEAESSYATEEAVTDSYYQDADDMAGVAVAESDQTDGGKLSSESGALEVEDDRFCAQLTLLLDLESTLLHPIGEITIDFGEGCTDPRGNVRSGIIRIHFDGRRFVPGSSLVISFHNYVINGVKLNGVRTLTNITGSTEASPKFQIELDNGSVEWSDGTSATREHCFELTWNRGVLLTPADDELVVNQCADADVAAAGINRRGIEYTMTIEEELVYKRGCPMAVSGVKKFVAVATGKEIIIDYGDGECDTMITITVNGNIHNVNARRRN